MYTAAMSGRSSSITASRSTIDAMITAWSIDSPLALIAARISGVSAVPNWVSSLCATASGRESGPLSWYSRVSGGM